MEIYQKQSFKDSFKVYLDKSNKDINCYVFFDVFNDKKKLITEAYKIHKRINIISLTQKDEKGIALMGEE